MAETDLDLISTAEAASILGVEPATVNRWVARGDLAVAAKLTGLRGANVFHRREIEQVAAERARLRCPTCGHRLEQPLAGDGPDGSSQVA
jgi:transposase